MFRSLSTLAKVPLEDAAPYFAGLLAAGGAAITFNQWGVKRQVDGLRGDLLADMSALRMSVDKSLTDLRVETCKTNLNTSRRLDKLEQQLELVLAKLSKNS